MSNVPHVYLQVHEYQCLLTLSSVSIYAQHAMLDFYLCLNCPFPGGSEVKASAWNAGDPDLIPGLGRSPGEGNGNPFQYSCLENPMEAGAWWATVHGVAKSRKRLSDFTFTFKLSHRNLFFHISGGQKSGIKVLAGLIPFGL